MQADHISMCQSYIWKDIERERRSETGSKFLIMPPSASQLFFSYQSYQNNLRSSYSLKILCLNVVLITI